MTEPETPSREQSEFNMSIETLRTIRTLLNVCIDSSMNYDTHSYIHALNNLLKESIPYIKKKEEKQQKKEEIKNLMTEVNEKNIKNQRTGNSTIEPELFWKLDSFEYYLRQVLADSGVLTKKKDDAGTALK